MAQRPPLQSYPSNAHSRREEDENAEEKKALPAPEKEKKTVALQGTVVKRKKSLSMSFASVFFGQEARNVVNYILYDILVPAAKDTITSMVKNGIEMIVYGETRRDDRRRSGNGTHVSYDRFYDDRDRGSRREYKRIPDARYDFSDIIFDRRVDAETVLNTLRDAIDQYDEVTVAEFYTTCGFASSHVDENYGWTNLKDADYERVNGGYILDLPRPRALNS